MKKKSLNNISKHKINEANYFLSMMKEEFGDDEIFDYNLSAFVSASRSITEYMEEQYGRIEGFPEWYCVKDLKMRADPDLKYLRKARNKTIHEKPIDLLTSTENNETFYINHPGHGVDTPIYYEKLTNRLFSSYKEKDTLIFCEEQLNKLTEIVEECEQRFG